MKKRLSILAVLCLIGITVGVRMATQSDREIRHIVLISIDTCRADYLSCYGYPRQTTPHIDAFAGHATRFEYVLSPVPQTLPAHSSMLTGTIPPFHGVHKNIGYQLASSSETLAEILKQNGFHTAAIVSSFVLDKNFGMAQGFDIYDDQFREVHHNEHGNERKGYETTQVALEWLDQIDAERKSFLFLHYYDPHDEYIPPEPFASEYADNPYAGEIAFTDHCIGQVIDKLKELELYDSTLLIITGDHGEMLGEHGELEHTYFIYESAIKVPLLVKLPGQKKGATVTQPVGLVDLVPTLCSLLDIDRPARVQGHDIVPLLYGDIPEGYERFIYSESVTPTRFGASSLMSISTGRWKYIQAPRAELYDISADPGEENNLIEKEPHRARILEDRLLQVLEQSVRRDPDSRIQLDAESIKRLESLGYVAGKAEGEIVFDETREDPKDLIHFFVQYQEVVKLVHKQKYGQAEQLLLSLIPQRPSFHEVYMQMGDVSLALGKFDQSVDYYRRADQLKPNQPVVLNNLAWLQATRPSLPSRNVEEALSMAWKLCKMSNYRNPNTLDTLAVCYAAAGDFPKAIETAKKAIMLARAAHDTALATKIANRLKLFEQSKPYIEE